ncbi:MAG: translation initiation factor IF-2 [Chloroflexi bacterium]|nr:translation initiation factor IF-2 [Chloroflexota bacterium]
MANQPAKSKAAKSGSASRRPAAGRGAEFLEEIDEGARPSRRGGSAKRPEDRRSSPAPQRPAPEPPAQPEKPRVLELPPSITVRDLAQKMGCSPIDLIKALMNAGVMANINQQIDFDTAAIVAEDMGFTVQEFKAPEPQVAVEESKPAPTIKKQREYTEEERKNLRERPPVVTILGHVDHGKTSLLDVIRSTNVQAREAGGITQHIGAYQVEIDGKAITFLDTPGHEAFAAMRARGAMVTDIAVLVVAADDGVQPQTREAIDHARAAQVPIVVAINKIDLPNANPDYVKQQLADLGLVPEDWGGETICVPVSAKQEIGIDALLESILLVAEMAELKANPRAKPRGWVIESRLDRALGPTATLLIQEGTLKVGDTILVGTTYGKIRAMYDYKGQLVKRATPAMPVVVSGLKDVPNAGDQFEAVESERVAREMAAQRALEAQQKAPRPAQSLSLEEIYAQAQAGNVQSLNIVLKADVQGSIEPIVNSLSKIKVGELGVEFIHQGLGNITESDVMLAIASKAIVIGFNVDIEPAAERLANAEGVDVRTYNVIYRLIEDVQLALTGMLEPQYQDVLQGRAVVRQVFHISRVGDVAGAQVIEGKALRNAKMRIVRNGEVLFEGPVASLKRFTEDVREVLTGFECGIGVGDFKGLQVGDIIEFYTRERVNG